MEKLEIMKIKPIRSILAYQSYEGRGNYKKYVPRALVNTSVEQLGWRGMSYKSRYLTKDEIDLVKKNLKDYLALKERIINSGPGYDFDRFKELDRFSQICKEIKENKHIYSEVIRYNTHSN
jgi:hypothetical protein